MSTLQLALHTRPRLLAIRLSLVGRFALRALTAATLATALLTGMVACNSTPKPTEASRTPAILPVETFDAAWTMVRDEHFDSTLNGVDWEAVRVELRPKAQQASTNEEVRAIIADMLARLGQSHFTIIPSATAERSPSLTTPNQQGDASTSSAVAAQNAPATHDDSGLPANAPAAAASKTHGGPGVAGLDIAIVDNEPTILRVSAGLPAARAGVLVGWKLVSVDGNRIDDGLAPIRAALKAESDPTSPHARKLRATLAFAGGSMLAGQAGEQHRVVFMDASGAEQQALITLEPAPLGTTHFGNLPPFPIEVESRIVELPREAGDTSKPVRVGVISFNIWMTGASEAIDLAVDALRGCDGIVIDLRGNPGGLGAMSMGVAGHFLRDTSSLGSMIGRENTLEFRSTPRKVSVDGKRVRPYATRPLAILVDGRSASTSEVFAGGLQDLGRARIFGEVSAGMALPAQATELPNGDVLLHAVADFVTSKGTRLEGRGVIPDEVAIPTRAALLQGDDAALTAATTWIRTTTMIARAAKAAPEATPNAASGPAIIPYAMPN